jgi:hypothetical protein
MIEVEFHRPISHGGLGIYLFDFKVGYNGKTFIAKPAKLEWLELDDYMAHANPFLEISRIDVDPFLKSIRNQLDERGVKSEPQTKLEGVLEATKFHLQDMRDLVFKKEAQCFGKTL